ncbi:hypothetical protein CMEL01_02683 [Colletotrichum melonis]|uniref:Uncharacterized protein n=1 Tax=Colletotrichum melonis TaxID=1209925 RepID=A0AAI9XTK3_9PEZI|nr:hypothetical protein CMEL01_02683 [Colletotrichum melonis]
MAGNLEVNNDSRNSNNNRLQDTEKYGEKLNSNQFSLSKAPTTFKMGVREITPASNMGRGAYDTTGVPKPPPRPKPR